MLVGHIGLVVVDLKAARLQEIAGAARELDVDHRVSPAVRDEHAQPPAALEVRLPALDVGHEPREREDPGTSGRSAPRPSE